MGELYYNKKIFCYYRVRVDFKWLLMILLVKYIFIVNNDLVVDFYFFVFIYLMIVWV